MKLLAPCHWFCLQPAAASPSSPAIRVLSACQELFIEQGLGGEKSWYVLFLEKQLSNFVSTNLFFLVSRLCVLSLSAQKVRDTDLQTGALPDRDSKLAGVTGYRPAASGSPGLISAKPYSAPSSQCTLCSPHIWDRSYSLSKIMERCSQFIETQRDKAHLAKTWQNKQTNKNPKYK